MSEDKQQPEIEQPEAELVDIDETIVGEVEDTPEAEVAENPLRQEVDALRDQVLRSQAELQNSRRRAEQDVEKAHKFGTEKFAKEMLPVVDNLERALEAMPAELDEAQQSIREGVEMTLQSMLSALAKFQVVQLNPVNEMFDPQLHQAMSMVENLELPANTVIAVMQKGFTQHGRLVRPAMVMVSKGGPVLNSIDETA